MTHQAIQAITAARRSYAKKWQEMKNTLKSFPTIFSIRSIPGDKKFLTAPVKKIYMQKKENISLNLYIEISKT